MTEVFSRHGVQFEYPDDWELDEQQSDFEIQVTVQSPETSFWSLSLILDRPEPLTVANTAIAALRELYDEIDVYPSDGPLCERETVARDMEFVCLELVNSAYVRAFQTDSFTALVFYQGTDSELEETRELMEDISRSLVCEEQFGMRPQL